MYNYLKTFLSGRTIQTKVGNVYSNERHIQMGIPQGAVIAPILFNILIHDLPKSLSKNVELAQYADDICIWMKVTLKRHTPVRSINYIKKIYQNELDKISRYMIENGLALSAEKSHMVLFNTGYDPNPLTSFQIDGLCLEY